MGNTVVFKPSDKAPACGRLLAEIFGEALEVSGAPAGVFNLVQGGALAATRLASGEGVDGVLFTGSWPVGRKILVANLDRPGRLLALEMGGNNAAVVLEDADLRQAAIECVRSAFVSAGQRCTCTRRVIVQRGVADEFVERVKRLTEGLLIGEPSAEPSVFMGPLISRGARQAVLDAQGSFEAAGARALLRAEALAGEGWYLTPGLMEVPAFTEGEAGAGADVEVFGPLLRMSVVSTLEEGIAQANATQFGLAASVFTRDARCAERFMREVRAGCINWNTGTAGASSKLPFGGLGRSGNHRPAGAFSLDYCAYPVAGMVELGASATLAPGMRE
jgi:succinylglutamic semialdehyde dehydrogenase